MPQPAPPRVPIEQPKETLPVDPGPIETLPVMPEPTPQPKYDPYAYSDIGRRALGGEYIDSMTFHYFDPTTGKFGSTTKGYSRVPDSAKPYIYLNKEEADKARDKFLEYEDTGGATTPTPKRTPVTAPPPPSTPIPETTGAAPAQQTIEQTPVAEQPSASVAPPAPQVISSTPSFAADAYRPNYGTAQTVGFTNPEGMADAVYNRKLASPRDGRTTSSTPLPPSLPLPVTPVAPTVPQPMPSMPSLPSIPLPKLPTLGGRPSLTRPIMRLNPRER